MNDALPMLRNGSIVTVCDIIEFIRTNAELDSLILEYDLTDQVACGGSIAKTILNLKKFAVQHPEHRVMTDLGERPLAADLVDKAINIARKEKGAKSKLEKLERYLNLGDVPATSLFNKKAVSRQTAFPPPASPGASRHSGNGRTASHRAGSRSSGKPSSTARSWN